MDSPIDATPLRCFRPVSIDGDHSETGNTSSPAPLMATPLQMVRPGTTSHNVTTSPLVPAYVPGVGPLKRGRGRPKGSKNKTTKRSKVEDPSCSGVTTCPSGDDPQNITTALALVATPAASFTTSDPLVQRGCGRPKGSKNGMTARKRKVDDPNSRRVTSCSDFESKISNEERENGNKEIVDWVLMRFDAARRILCQLVITKDVPHTALSNCMEMGVRTNMKKRVGSVPGVNVGDVFYLWGEMRLVGLHMQPQAGIDYMSDEGEVETLAPLATSVVTTGRYDDKQEDMETWIYTGHGAQLKDQKLERGNLALVESSEKESDVRVIIGESDPNNKSKKIYIYDGLYTVLKFWENKNKFGFIEYKFKLVRKPGQPSGYAVWKTVEGWRRGNTRNVLKEDISCGKEPLQVPVVNEVDDNDKTTPEDFVYTCFQYYSTFELDLTSDHPNPRCDNCGDQSCPKDSNCKCLARNDGKLPYHDQILVCRKPMIKEFGGCTPGCKLKVVLNGLKLRVEVFKTEKCGWGLRSWEPIRAGTFICEFAGKNKTKEEVEEEGNNDYLFNSSRIYKQFKWNYEPELVKEGSSETVPEEYNLPNQVLISAKDIGNVGRFINHSCSPNIFWQPIKCKKDNQSYVSIGFFAMKHIPPLTELTYDYGMSCEELKEDGTKILKGNKTCLCASPNCCGTFG